MKMIDLEGKMREYEKILQIWRVRINQNCQENNSVICSCKKNLGLPYKIYNNVTILATIKIKTGNISKIY